MRAGIWHSPVPALEVLILGLAKISPAPAWQRALIDEADALAFEMLRKLLHTTRWEMEILSEEGLSAELVALAGEIEPAVVCLGALPPGGLAR